ncbi:multicopper oxidase family protein [Hoyosella subflava]|uniref:Multicopper oxidase CueO n=1 Tax=Hoyosella subflava (strain DSM 45089 / JCM 17490 / NBRC 109087 / DQS3-9A1) TaxID=443218 RepID=F6EHM0_HOYSD|nr:multicopper oxidase domain-containing protein [Hoyosella subflava]AEF42384.1 Spore coat protein (Outer) [Hoyosella subflava DQS3-9A1]
MTTHVSRRQLLRIGGGVVVAGAAAGLGLLTARGSQATNQLAALVPSDLPLPARFTVPLPRPAQRSGAEISLVQRYAEQEILPGRRTRVTGYDGMYPGPTIRARRGAPVHVSVQNDLDIGTVMHLHGGRMAPEHDGYPTDVLLPHSGHVRAPLMPGNTTVGARSYVYPMDQRAATLWYHDHAMDFTGPNVYAGLAGFCILTDAEEEALGLPSNERDVELMLADRSFTSDAQFKYPALAPDQSVPGVEPLYLAGVLGDVMLVNGAPWPVHEVSRNLHRLRWLNGSNARNYRLELAPGGTLIQIGSDGGLLEEPAPRNSIALSPGERMDTVVDFSQYPVGTLVTVRNTLGAGPMDAVMQFRVVRDAHEDARVPDKLSQIEWLRREDAVRTRDFIFALQFGGGHGHSAAQARGGGFIPHQWTINGRPFDTETDWATPNYGDVEIWRFTAVAAHPVHVHLAHMQVLSRSSGAPRPSDAGLKDTVDLGPMESCEVIARFDGFRGRYVMHCHNLEHEDMAMMANFTVV